ncbi:Pr6Pr family membrane protein [Actinosynnema sp. NPDC020468]|uniref:Pr6Pr family membrane protein n=1 Tax=Actinosynnema sp. NPDC020468 TaxID=3154488 RepID=UPI0033F9A595
MRRAWFALTALVVLVALVVQVSSTLATSGGRFPDPGARLVNLFCFFTIQSNVLVLLTTAVLVFRERPPVFWRVLRLDGVLSIAVTGVVYHLVLAGLYELHGAALLADVLLHTVSPLLCVAGWLVFGPRGLVTPRIVAWSTVYPLAWLAFTLVRGAVIDYYPYPFVDVATLGYARVALNCALVAVLFLGLGALALWLDRLLTRVREAA